MNCVIAKPFKLLNQSDFSSPFVHYENLPMQYTELFLALKIENFK